MNGIDFRNATFHSLRNSLRRDRMDVYTAWVSHGPGTTRQIATASGIDILTFRPRTTDLVQVGLVRCIGGQKGEGIYQAVPEQEWERWRADMASGQLALI